MKRRELVRQLHIKDVIIEHWRNECLRLMRELTNLSQMKIERIPGEKEFAAMQAALDEISAHNEELIKKVAALTAENERIKKERNEALEDYYKLLSQFIDKARYDDAIKAIIESGSGFGKSEEAKEGV